MYGPGSQTVYCNMGRCLTGEAVWREVEILCDIAGGVAATFPEGGVRGEIKRGDLSQIAPYLY